MPSVTSCPETFDNVITTKDVDPVSDDEEVDFVRKTNCRRKHNVAESDDSTDDEIKFKVTKIPQNVHDSTNENSATKDSNSSDRSDTDEVTKTKKLIRKRIRKLCSSDDEDNTLTFTNKNIHESQIPHSESDADSTPANLEPNTSIVKKRSGRMLKRDKLFQEIRNKFDKSKPKAQFESEECSSKDCLGSINPGLTSICDTDTSSSSDEDVEKTNIKVHQFNSSENAELSYLSEDDKHTIPTYKKSGSKPKRPVKEEKSVRMSAKQAMENMQKIKSESSRMLREKEVSLPYHRPKALSLKEILAKKRPIVSNIGRLSIKMNEDQLKDYAMQLEQRQKAMIELYKSDSEDEIENEKNPDCIDTEMKIDDNSQTLLEAVSKLLETEIENKHSQKEELVPNMPIINTKLNMQNNELMTDTDLNNSNKTEDVDTIDSELNDTTFDDLLNNSDNTDQNVQASTPELKLKLLTKNQQLDTEKTPKETEQNSENFTDSESQLIALNFNSENTACNEDLNNQTASESHQGKKNLSTDFESIEKERSIKENSASMEDLQMETTNENSDLTGHKLETSNDNNVAILDAVESDDNQGVTSNDKKIKSVNDTTSSNLNESEIERNKALDAEIERNKALDAEIEAHEDFFSDDVDMANIEDILERIENADKPILEIKPKITGAPGMVIDLDDEVVAKKSGLELLKERFIFFARIKTPDEDERQKEKKIKPGAQLLKLKLELEEQIAEQRSREWAKRLEEETLKQQIKAINGDLSDCEDELEKEEGQGKQNDPDAANKKGEQDLTENNSSEEESEDEENLLEDNPKPEKKRKINPLIDDEAEEDDENGDDLDDDDDNAKDTDNAEKAKTNCKNGLDDKDMDEASDEEDDYDADDSGEESSSSDEDDINSTKPRKGRIIKAFEDSDDEPETIVTNPENKDVAKNIMTQNDKIDETKDSYNEEHIKKLIVDNDSAKSRTSTDEIIASQVDGDEEFTLGQKLNTSTADSTFTDPMDTSKVLENTPTKDSVEKLNVICESQPCIMDTQARIDDVIGLCSGSFPSESQEVSPMHYKGDQSIEIESNPALPFTPNMGDQSTQASQVGSQLFGEDVLAMCTGQFVNNEIVSPMKPLETQEELNISISKENTQEPIPEDPTKNANDLLDEYDKPKTNKYFDKENEQNNSNITPKGKLVIESDDEEIMEGPKKIRKKRKLEDRALQFSDDEDEMSEVEESDLDDVEKEDGDRIVDYDSEENEVVVTTKSINRKARDFFEQEAELSTEDEWVGSGDEDEAGLDRLEREAGDDDTFHQGKLRRELEQIHMRDVLDQDKREVRMLQEILLEDGDLGGGQRQRKFRWRNADGEEQLGTVPDEFADTQEDEMETEEQWRKQRHERQMFLKKMMEENDPDSLNISVSRTEIIKANLLSKTMSSVLLEAKTTTTVQCTEESPKDKEKEKKSTVKDLPSPVKKPFSIMQRQYGGSLLGLGRGSLKRLAALAEPIAGASDQEPANFSALAAGKGNFVFATLSPSAPEDQAKVSKRKADLNTGTPKLMKRLKMSDSSNSQFRRKQTLIEHLDT